MQVQRAGTRVALVRSVSRLIPPLALLGLALTALGCYATAGAYTEADYVETDYVPPRVEVYPRYVYAGRTVYLVDGRWYYRRGPRWVYYREEPVELHRRRVYIERAPHDTERHEARRHHRGRHDEDRD